MKCVLLQLKKGGVAKAKGEGEREGVYYRVQEPTAIIGRWDEKAPWALNYENGEGWGPPHAGIPACRLGIEPKTPGWLRQAQAPAQRGSGGHFIFYLFITAEKGRVAKAKGAGEYYCFITAEKGRSSEC